MKTRVESQRWGFAFLFLVLPLIGCGDSHTEPVDHAGTTGLSLSMDIVGDTDVVGFEIAIEACGPLEGSGGGAISDGSFDASLSSDESFTPIRYVVDLEDMPLQMGESPFEPDTEHLFADQFVVVPPGCYDVVATPLRDLDTIAASVECGAASQGGVSVVGGRTTEIVLVSQCGSDDPGAVDVVATLNHAPEIAGGEYDPSKFLSDCELATVCLDYHDPDGDPVEVEWTVIEAAGEPVLVGEPTGEEGCFQFAFKALGDYTVRATVYDLFSKDGQYVRAEEWFADRGRDEDSHASLELLFHIGTNAPFLCFDGAGVATLPGVRVPERYPGCEFVDAEAYYCDVVSDTSICPSEGFNASLLPRCDQCAGEPNACGGCAELEIHPGDPCGPCGLDEYICEGPDVLSCSAATTNACDGCGPLPAGPGDACGPCELDTYVCEGAERLVCDGATHSPGGECGETDWTALPGLSTDITGPEIVGVVSGSTDVVAYRVIRFDGTDYEYEQSDNQYMLVPGVTEYLNESDASEYPNLRRGRGVLMVDDVSWYFTNYVVESPLEHVELGPEEAPEVFPVLDPAIAELADDEMVDVFVMLPDDRVFDPLVEFGRIVYQAELEDAEDSRALFLSVWALYGLGELAFEELESLLTTKPFTRCEIPEAPRAYPLMGAFGYHARAEDIRCLGRELERLDEGYVVELAPPIEFAQDMPSMTRAASDRPNSGLQRAQRVNATEFWEHGMFGGHSRSADIGTQPVVGIIDSGLNADHVAFESLRRVGDDRVFVGECNSWYCMDCEPNSAGMCDGAGSEYDNQPHGTHVAGVLGAQPYGWGTDLVAAWPQWPNSSSELWDMGFYGPPRERLTWDTAGIAPDVAMWMAGVGSPGPFEIQDSLHNMAWFVNVMNMSTGSGDWANCLRSPVSGRRMTESARNAGVLLVGVAGNNERRSDECTVPWPHHTPSTLTVGGLDEDMIGLREESGAAPVAGDWPDMVDLLAPAYATFVPAHPDDPATFPDETNRSYDAAGSCNVWSSLPSDVLTWAGTYRPGQCLEDPYATRTGSSARAPAVNTGTSLAAPVVSGVAALIQESLIDLGAPDWWDPNLLHAELLLMGESLDGEHGGLRRAEGAGALVATPWYVPGGPRAMNPPFVFAVDAWSMRRGDYEERPLLSTAEGWSLPLPERMEYYRHVFWQRESRMKLGETGTPSIEMTVEDDPRALGCATGISRTVPLDNSWMGRVHLDGHDVEGGCMQVRFDTTRRFPRGQTHRVAHARVLIPERSPSVYTFMHAAQGDVDVTVREPGAGLVQLASGETVTMDFTIQSPLQLHLQWDVDTDMLSHLGRHRFDYWTTIDYARDYDYVDAWPSYADRWLVTNAAWPEDLHVGLIAAFGNPLLTGTNLWMLQTVEFPIWPDDDTVVPGNGAVRLLNLLPAFGADFWSRAVLRWKPGRLESTYMASDQWAYVEPGFEWEMTLEEHRDGEIVRYMSVLNESEDQVANTYVVHSDEDWNLTYTRLRQEVTSWLP